MENFENFEKLLKSACIINNFISQSHNLYLKAYPLKKFSEIYQVDVRTFKKGIKLFNPKIGIRIGRFYTINQVKIIFESIGTPEFLSE